MVEDFEGLEGQALVDALLAMGAEEVFSNKGMKALVIGAETVAKECSYCLKIKGFLEFHTHARRFVSLEDICIKCKKKSRVSSREKEQERARIRGRQRQYKASCKGSRQYQVILHHNRMWQKRNPEYMRMQQAKRRTIAKSLPFESSRSLVEINSKKFGNVCSLTGQAADIHADHVIPLAIGHGGTTYGNMIPLAAALNISKSDAHIFEWFDANRERFNLEQSRFDALIEYLADANEMTTAEYRAYVDWCFDNPRIIDDATGGLVFRDGPINERNKNGKQAIA